MSLFRKIISPQNKTNTRLLFSEFQILSSDVEKNVQAEINFPPAVSLPKCTYHLGLGYVKSGTPSRSPAWVAA